MTIEVIRTVGLRTLGILLVLAGAALLIPSFGATEKRSKSRAQEAASYSQLAACLRSDTRPDECRRAARKPAPSSP
jgi:hypothetical protein